MLPGGGPGERQKAGLIDGDARLTEVLHEHLDVELQHIHATQRLQYLLLKCLLAWQFLLLRHLQGCHPCISVLTHVQTGLCFVLLVWVFAGQIAALDPFGKLGQKGFGSKILSGKTGSKLSAVHIGCEP